MRELDYGVRCEKCMSEGVVKCIKEYVRGSFEICGRVYQRGL